MKIKNLKELSQEIEQIEARLIEMKKAKVKLEAEVEHLEDAIAEEKGKITTANINVKNFTTRRLKSNREKNKMVREEKELEEVQKLKKKQLDKAKKTFFDTMKEKKDFTTEKYGPDYLQDLGGLLIENGNEKNKKKEGEKKDDNESN